MSKFKLIVNRYFAGIFAFVLMSNGPMIYADKSKPHIESPNGRAVQVDLNGDGRMEKVSLRERPGQNRNSRRFSIQVNGQIFSDVWQDSWVDGVGSLSLEFKPLKRRSHQRYLFVGGPYGLEWEAYKIYAWQNGKIRPVLQQAMMIDRIDSDGSLVQLESYNWSYALFRWRMNRQGVFQMMPRSIYPLHGGVGTTGQVGIPIRPLKTVRFHKSPRASSPTFLIPKGEKILFDGITANGANGWVRARYGKKLGWLPFKTVDNSFSTFNFLRAG